MKKPQPKKNISARKNAVKKNVTAKLENKDELLKRLKDCVRESRLYDKKNYDRFNFFNNFVFNTTLDSDTLSILQALGKPPIELNVQEVYVNRVVGEFAQNEPSFVTEKRYDSPVDDRTIDIFDGHLRNVLADAEAEGVQYEIIQNSIGGGWGVSRVYTEYPTPMSFDPVVKFANENPLLCGFDPNAQKRHKGDGDYCFRIYPFTEEQFKKEYPHVDTSKITFSGSMQDFRWAYVNHTKKIVLVCEFFEKITEKKKIVKLANGQIVLKSRYEKFIDMWEKQGYLAQPPMVQFERETELTYIRSHLFIEDQFIAESVDTDFSYLPLIYFDGNSRWIYANGSGSYQQMTRPYVYHSVGAQKLKNFSGQTLASELENLVQHKIMIAEESLPTDSTALAAYQNIQKARTLIYKAFSDGKPIANPPPQPVTRTPIPPEVTNTIAVAGQAIKESQGQFDYHPGIDKADLSGEAIVMGALQGDSSAFPYIKNYLICYTHQLRVLADVITKTYTLPREVSVVPREGEKYSENINDDGQPSFDFDSTSLLFNVKPGASSKIQRLREREEITSMMRASKIFDEFINTDGLDILVKTLTTQHADELEKRAKNFMSEMKQRQAAALKAQQEAARNNPLMIQAQTEQYNAQTKRMEAEAKVQKTQVETHVEVAKVSVEEQKAENDQIKTLATISESQAKVQAAEARARAEETRAAVDLAIKTADMSHQHKKDVHEFNHKREMEMRAAQQKERHETTEKETINETSSA